MTRRAGLSPAAFLLSVAIGIAIFVLAMVVIGVRLDSGPPQPEPASVSEEARQDAATAYALLAEAAEGANPDVASMARAHEEAVGGVWVPWPEGAPEGATNPPAPQSDTADVMILLERAVEATEHAVQTVDPADAPLFASILLRQQIALDALTEEEAIAAEPLVGLAEFATEQTLLTLDTARQWLETAAAHLDPNESAVDSIAEVDTMTSAILSSGMADSRLAVAPLPSWFLADPSPETAAQLEAEAKMLIAAELFSYIPTSDPTVDLQIVSALHRYVAASTVTDFPLIEVQ
ncbi:hypothetical protein [Flaviflexus equikiangi]|uniref:hypothetical protein n=1 Tax=Flaviflexus equikiangi TaxID=2758573 RepID=UPI0015F47F69|nr:hypothetical protein [Flaviflexus equikiangi]